MQLTRVGTALVLKKRYSSRINMQQLQGICDCINSHTVIELSEALKVLKSTIHVARALQVLLGATQSLRHRQWFETATECSAAARCSAHHASVEPT